MTLNEFQRVSVCSDKKLFFYTKLPTFVKDAPQNDNKNEQIAQCPLIEVVIELRWQITQKRIDRNTISVW